MKVDTYKKLKTIGAINTSFSKRAAIVSYSTNSFLAVIEYDNRYDVNMSNINGERWEQQFSLQAISLQDAFSRAEALWMDTYLEKEETHD